MLKANEVLALGTETRGIAPAMQAPHPVTWAASRILPTVTSY